MPVIQVKDKQHTLRPGQTRIGAGPGVDVSVSDDAALGLQAVMELVGNNQVVIRRARDGVAVRVNGIPLAEPTPLIHGDKVEIAGTEILFSEDKKVGATQFVSASEVAGIAAKRSGPARATAGTGGRLVSLVDGKEYTIPNEGITFGREAGSDVVVAQPEVSRKHATIGPTENGYVLQDHSTNGVWVNGTRVQGSQLLARADVVRVGTEEFRFYADVAPIAKTPAGAPAQPGVAAQRPPTPTGVPAQPAPAAPMAAPPSPAPAAPRPPQVPSAEPTARVPTIPPALTAPSAPPAAPSPAAAPSAEPTARVPHMPPARTPEPPTAPARPMPPRPRKEPATADSAKDDKKGGIPAWIWIAIIAVVGVAAYFLGQGRG